MPLQATSGAASYDAFGGGVAAVPNYIEDVFSTYLYTGNGSTQTITNGIDLSTKGGLVWVKRRATVRNHLLFDTARGVGREIYSNTTDAQNGPYDTLTSFNTTGFSLGTEIDVNASGQTMASWTFRKQPKFFDVVTYTGNGAGQGARAVPHNLQSTPGCIIIKRTDSTSAWAVWHRFAGVTNEDLSGISLNSTAAAIGYPNGTTALMNAASFDPANIYGADAVTCNANGATYVAYLFAHDAGGFGLTGTDNVISCGSYTGTGSVPNNITLGFEPQWLLVKNTTSSGQEWGMFDNMRGLVTGSGGDAYLYANSSGAEGSGTYLAATATGFSCEDVSARYNNSGDTYIYIAIRRGPMKVPTSGTSVFSPEIGLNAASNGLAFDSGFVSDFLIRKYRPGTSNIPAVSRLTGDKGLYTTTTGAEYTETYASKWDSMLGVLTGTSADFSEQIGWVFRRAPSFFDEVCYTGVFTAQTINHNLTVAPEMIITKKRSSTSAWPVYHIGVPSPQVNQPNLNATGGYYANNWYPGAPTSTTFTAQYQDNGSTYVAYLFATCPGVSKVGSYTGTGATQTISCGFTGGARFVLVKRTDSTGDWYVWDTARGMVSGTDPSLLLNDTAAEVNANSIYTTTGGFQIVSTAAGINASGGNYIFLAIA